MSEFSPFEVVCLILVCSTATFASDIILNEYNAVDPADFLNGGNAAVDQDGGRAYDSYFGRIQGNGGDWFELVVIKDHLDMRAWKFDIYNNGTLDKTLNLTNHSIWSDLRSGTIITVAEDVPSDVSYDPGSGDWWINVQAHNGADGLYIDADNFAVSSNNWQLRIRDSTGKVVFGPAGEGVSPATGIGNTEIFRLEADPSGMIAADSPEYDDGKDFSTFGAPNRWGGQDFRKLRTLAASPASIEVSFPKGLEVLAGGTTATITWETNGTINDVLVEFSIDNGNTWLEAYPPNVGNAGKYDWLVPLVDSQHCLIRVANRNNLRVYDVCDQPFSIYVCGLPGDINGDCVVDMADFALLASYWLESGGP
jgi:hypothetical protein